MMPPIGDAIETRPCRYGVMSFFKNDTIISRSLREYGEWAEAEVEFLCQLVGPGDTVLDVGAFIGTHTLAFAHRVGEGGKIYAFEPQLPFFEVLKKNIEQNGLRNVTVLQAAVSDKIGQLQASEIDVHNLYNFGGTSLLQAGAVVRAPRHGSRVRMATIDRLAIKKCALIKIDAENMEINVLKGARKTLHAARPTVFAECNSLEYGWPVVEFAKEQGYDTYLLSILAYSPDNFRRNHANFLGDGREVGLILIPPERRGLIRDWMHPSRYPSLIPISSIDDLALALLKKPQYKYEVMSKTQTAQAWGVDFWANEPEVRQLQTDLANLSRAREALRQDREALQQERESLQQTIQHQEESLTQATEKVANLSRERSALAQDHQHTLHELQTNNAILNQIYTSGGWRALSVYYRLRDKSCPEGSRRRLFAKRVSRILPWVGKLLSKWFRTIARPASNAREDGKELVHSLDQARQSSGSPETPTTADPVVPQGPAPGPSAEMGPDETPSSLPPLYSLDRLKIKGRKVHGFGWLFHKEREVSGVRLVIGTGAKTHALPAFYGGNRQDVASVYAHPNARSCGFWVAGKLPFENPSTFSLEVDYQDGGMQVLPARPPEPESKLAGVRITRLRLLSGTKALLRGDIGSVLRQIREERASQSANRCQFEDVLRLLDERSPGDGPSLPGPAGGSKRKLPRIGPFLDAAKQSRFSERKFVLVIDHNLGGGANKYRRDLIGQILKRDRPVLLLYYDLPELTYVITYIDAGSTETRFQLDSVASLLGMCGKIGVEEIIVNNVYSFDDPLRMAALICDLKRVLNAPVTVAIHDYFQICPSYTLLNEVGTFCGVPELTRCEECLPNNHGEFSLLAEEKDIRRWRAAWRMCLQEAAKICCFSESSVRLLQRAYPTLDRTKFVVLPHQLDRAPAKKPRLDLKADLNIGVVGNIAEHKGAHVVTALAASIQRRKLAARITVLGTISSNPPGDVITVTGPYDVEKLPDLIQKHCVNMFLFPSIWPETFSYVCEELMQLEVPLAVFNIGAPPERVARYRRGLILDGVTAEQTLDGLIAFQEALRQEELIGQDR